MKSQLLSAVVCLAFTAFLGGCASGGNVKGETHEAWKIPENQATFAKLKDSVPPQAIGKGRVYFYTVSNIGVTHPEIHVNDAYVGHVKGDRVFFVDLQPGHYKVDSGGSTDQADFSLDAGDTRYVKFGRDIAIFGSVNPEVVSRSEGEQEVQSLTFDEDRRYELTYPPRQSARVPAAIQ